MIVVGTDRDDMALVEQPIAGLMADERAEVVADKAQNMIEIMAACGCTLNNAYMQNSRLALVVIPEIRISDVGIIDVTKSEEVGCGCKAAMVRRQTFFVAQKWPVHFKATYDSEYGSR